MNENDEFASAATVFTVEDSGEHEEFEGGMFRDTAEDKIDYNITRHGPMYGRCIKHLDTARKKYPDADLGIPNWTLAEGQVEFARFIESAGRHFDFWMTQRLWELRMWSLEGKFTPMPSPEDEAAAVFFNINGTEYVRDIQ